MSRVLHSVLGSLSRAEWPHLGWQYRHRLTTLEELKSILGFSKDEEGVYQRLISTYRYAITPYYLSLAREFSYSDPVFRQCVPSLEELSSSQNSLDDPLGEEADTPVPGLVHKYPDRVLLVITNRCSVYCRYCTRKRAWNDKERDRSRIELLAMIDYIRYHREVREAIVSGGDPLLVSKERLEWLLKMLKAIPHLEVIRIGTRVPVVLPMRVTKDLTKMLGRYRPLWINTQFNHPQEITEESAKACELLLKQGIPVSNQTVLLRGINDSVKVIRELCHALQRISVRPYYLFQCDLVKGTDHLRTPVWKGIEIIEGLRGHTGGLCVPTFAVDLPKGGGKVPLQPNYLISVEEGYLILRNYQGSIFKYPNPPPGQLK